VPTKSQVGYGLVYNYMDNRIWENEDEEVEKIIFQALLSFDSSFSIIKVVKIFNSILELLC